MFVSIDNRFITTAELTSRTRLGVEATWEVEGWVIMPFQQNFIFFLLVDHKAARSATWVGRWIAEFDHTKLTLYTIVQSLTKCSCS
jgi:hypothetical protein